MTTRIVSIRVCGMRPYSDFQWVGIERKKSVWLAEILEQLALITGTQESVGLEVDLVGNVGNRTIAHGKIRATRVVATKRLRCWPNQGSRRSGFEIQWHMSTVVISISVVQHEMKIETRQVFTRQKGVAQPVGNVLESDRVQV